MPATAHSLHARALHAALPAAVTALAAAAVVRRAGPESHPIPILLTGLTPWAFAPAYPLALMALRRRRWWTFALAAGVAGAHAAWMAPELRRTVPAPESPSPGLSIRVALANLWVSNPKRAALGPALAGVHADVLVLQELKPPFVEELRRAGLFDAYPYQYLCPRFDPQGIGVLSKMPLEAPAAVPLETATAIGATIRVGAVPVEFWALHVHAPASNHGRLKWIEEFRALREKVPATCGPSIVVGDFNATMQHPLMSDFARRERFVEAHVAAGRPLASTWPANRRWLPPVMRLDHVFVRDFEVCTAQEFAIPGSDHRGVVADLVLRPRS
ncbi:MAG: Endonuclease/exonuclease/phosphatase [Actinomycetia bacterium]|nr:Endonuclease/exonuclease/phosphatase [Actinomycetes bacterium]